MDMVEVVVALLMIVNGEIKESEKWPYLGAHFQVG